jgi:endonuclease-3
VSRRPKATAKAAAKTVAKVVARTVTKAVSKAVTKALAKPAPKQATPMRSRAATKRFAAVGAPPPKSKILPTSPARGIDPLHAAPEYFDRLLGLYPDAHCELDYQSPWQLLVATILSARPPTSA